MVDRTAYEKLAAEYYYSELHPTSFNFREASSAVLQRWKSEISPRGSVICEVGPGRSTVVEVLGPDEARRHCVIFLDISLGMLMYVKGITERQRIVNADALRLPLKSASVDFLFAGLGDPYNTDEFWNEVARILHPHGAAVFTTPAFEWMNAFRTASARFEAFFELGRGEGVNAPSFIFPTEQQIALINASGLAVKDVACVNLADLKLEPLSPKLLPERGPRAPVVTGFLVHRSGRGRVRRSARRVP